LVSPRNILERSGNLMIMLDFDQPGELTIDLGKHPPQMYTLVL